MHGRVVLAAGTYGTQTLLHRMRDTGVLPRISPRLGELTRTNSEALVGALTFPRRYRRKRGPDAELDFTKGVAITSSIHPNENTHIENVRYGRGSNLMALICAPTASPRAWARRASSTPTTGSTDTPASRWSTARRSPPTWASTHP